MAYIASGVLASESRKLAETIPPARQLTKSQLFQLELEALRESSAREAHQRRVRARLARVLAAR